MIKMANSEIMNSLTTIVYLTEKVKEYEDGYLKRNYFNMQKCCKFLFDVLGVEEVSKHLKNPYKKHFLAYTTGVKDDTINSKATESLVKQSMFLLIKVYLKKGYHIDELEKYLSMKLPTEKLIIKSFNVWYNKKKEDVKKILKVNISYKKNDTKVIKLIDEILKKTNDEIVDEFLKSGYNSVIFDNRYINQSEFQQYNAKIKEIVNDIKTFKNEPKKLEKARNKLGKKLRNRYRYRKSYFQNLDKDNFSAFMDMIDTVIAQNKNFNIVLSQFGYEEKNLVDYDELIKEFLTYFKEETFASLTKRVIVERKKAKQKQIECAQNEDLASSISNLI
jgi:hypothetical protein